MKKHRLRVRKPKRRTAVQQIVVKPRPADGDELVYYHGGPAHMRPGDYLLPRSETGVPGWRDKMAPEEEERVCGEYSQVLEDADWCFITESFRLAAYYAVRRKLYNDAGSRHGAVYRVEPEGRLEIDGDRPVDCFRCERARIIGIEKVPFKLEQQIRSKIVGLHEAFRRGDINRSVDDFYALTL